MKVDVYRNLNKDKFSIRSREMHNYGIVDSYADMVIVKDVEFIVQNSGYNKFKDTGNKNVHAFVRGILCESFNFPTVVRSSLINNVLNSMKVYYDPEYDDKFWTECQTVIKKAKKVLCYKNTIYVIKE